MSGFSRQRPGDGQGCARTSEAARRPAVLVTVPGPAYSARVKTYRLRSLLPVLVLGACGGEAPAAVSPAGAPSVAIAAPPASDTPATPAAPAAPKPMLDLQMASLRAYVAAFNRHDSKAVAELYAPEANFIERGTPGNAGRAAIAANYQNYFDAYPDVTTAITRSWHWGDAALFEYVEGGTQTGQRIVLPPPPRRFDPIADGTDDGKAPERRSETPTGKKFGYVGASLLRFTPEGLVRVDMTYSDELTREVQSGWAPGALAKMPVRAVVAVPAVTDSWEMHQVGTSDAGQVKLLAAKASLYNKFSLHSEKDFLAALTDDVVLAAFDDPSDAKGKPAAAALLKDWTTTFADGVVDATEGWSVDGYVVVMGTFTGKQVGAWGPIKPTRSTFKTHFLDIVKLGKDDKVSRLWSYANNYELLQYLDYGAAAASAKKH
jgi:ketosteroid isomerase-like protein